VFIRPSVTCFSAVVWCIPFVVVAKYLKRDAGWFAIVTLMYHCYLFHMTSSCVGELLRLLVTTWMMRKCFDGLC